MSGGRGMPVRTVHAAGADDALRRLLEGNARYLRGDLRYGERLAEQRLASAAGQHPFAAVLGCSDSRVPPQLVFDQGPGALFTTRVAGNVATDSVVGTLEYAVEHLGVPLILVLGHTSCGAVSACIQGCDAPAAGHLGVLFEAIQPAVERARLTPGDPLESAVGFHVDNVVRQLRASEPVLGPRVRAGTLRVVGAVYDLESGAVTLRSGGLTEHVASNTLLHSSTVVD
jgi:carbonic anhydrase